MVQRAHYKLTALTTLICFVWVILLSCVLFLRWEVSTSSERWWLSYRYDRGISNLCHIGSFLFSFLGVDTLTVIMLPILSVHSSPRISHPLFEQELPRILAKFRTWLDGARLLLLLICHIGLAASFIIWNTTNPCPDDSELSCHFGGIFPLTYVQAPDSRGVCQLINVYLIIASWVPPLLRGYTGFKLPFLHLIRISEVILYGLGLATYAWRITSMPRGPLSAEAGSVRSSSQTQSDPVTTPMDCSSSGHISYLLASLPSSARDSRRESARKSRLEKRLPEHLF
jgi:hypothetical protein